MDLRGHLAPLGVCVVPCWLASTVAAIREQGLDLSPYALLQKVFAILLHTDIRQYAVGCLPDCANCIQDQCLAGPFMLQVNYVKNIAAALEYRSQDSISRCLMLALTDGKQPIMALEHRRIEAFKINMTMGTKLVLRDVRVKNGVLLLLPDRVLILGGDVTPKRKLDDANVTTPVSHSPRLIPLQSSQRPLPEGPPGPGASMSSMLPSLDCSGEGDDIDINHMVEGATSLAAADTVPHPLADSNVEAKPYKLPEHSQTLPSSETSLRVPKVPRHHRHEADVAQESLYTSSGSRPHSACVSPTEESKKSAAVIVLDDTEEDKQAELGKSPQSRSLKRNAQEAGLLQPASGSRIFANPEGNVETITEVVDCGGEKRTSTAASNSTRQRLAIGASAQHIWPFVYLSEYVRSPAATTVRVKGVVTSVLGTIFMKKTGLTVTVQIDDGSGAPLDVRLGEGVIAKAMKKSTQEIRGLQASELHMLVSGSLGPALSRVEGVFCIKWGCAGELPVLCSVEKLTEKDVRMMDECVTQAVHEETKDIQGEADVIDLVE